MRVTEPVLRSRSPAETLARLEHDTRFRERYTLHEMITGRLLDHRIRLGLVEPCRW